jgi:hypothetical protein
MATVGELIDFLSKLDRNLTVYNDTDGYGDLDINNIEVGQLYDLEEHKTEIAVFLQG